jgi:hypothetical protein
MAALAVAGCVLLAGCESKDDSRADVVFVGASITEAWNFDHYFPGYNFGKVIVYDADKTGAWGTVAGRNPRIVVVKECGAYFSTGGGTPLGDYQAIMADMAARCRLVGITPVLATTIPVDVGYGGCTQAQLNDIKSFNAWVRSYCAGQGIVCLDLAAAVADSSGQLPTPCHDGDGLHPNETGYDLLSVAVLPALRRAGL